MLSVAVQLVGIGIIYGVIKTQIKYIEKQLERLEVKQDKHNGLIERMVIAEQKIENIIDKVGDHIEDSKNDLFE